MQGASVDPTGRLRVVDAAPDAQATFNAGFAFNPDGRLCIGSFGGTNLPSQGGILTNDAGRMSIVASQAAQVYNKGWPQLNSGAVIQHLNVLVPANTPLVAGIAIDDTGVYMTTGAPPLPTNTVAPTITGVPQSSNTLTCNPGTWTNTDTITYQWRRNNVPMIGQNSNTLLVVSTYIGDTISCSVTGSNAFTESTATAAGVLIIP